MGDGTDERILGVAADLLRVHGLTGLEVDEVAARAGVGRSTVYRRFGDRNGLITATLAHDGRRLLRALADAVSGGAGADTIDLVDEVTAAFCAGLRLARDGGLSDLVRRDPLLLRLLTIEGGPVLAAARDELASLACRRIPGLEPAVARSTAEVLVRLGISFVVAPDSVLDPDRPEDEALIRRTVGALVRTPPTARSGPTPTGP